jgi:hypothetical protein
MKNLIMSLMILMVSLQVSSQVFGQKKSKVDPKDAKIDTLTRQLDTVSKELVIYKGVYDTLVKKVVHYKFNPTKTTFLVDSLQMRPKDSTFIKLAAVRADSITILKKENKDLKAVIATAGSDVEKAKLFMTQEEIDKAKVVATLKQYKELMDAKVITEAEYIVLKKKYLEKL